MRCDEVLKLMKTRRSIRKYTKKFVSEDVINFILEGGRWSPSGKNNQPWRFMVIRKRELKSKIANFTKYDKTVNDSQVLIVVFIHKPDMYDPIKDYQAIGACVQNMLLMAHSIGLGAVWIGEILNKSDKVRGILGLSEEFDLMALLVLGWPLSEKVRKGERKSLIELCLTPEEIQ